MSAVGAISTWGVLNCHLFLGGVNGETAICFWVELMEKLPFVSGWS